MHYVLVAFMIFTMAVVAPEVHANNVSLDVAITGGTSGFNVIHTDSLSFTDTINFTGVSGDLLASAGLVTIGFSSVTNIDFTSVTLNGIALSLTPSSSIEFAYTPTELAITAPPLTLVVSGTTGAGSRYFSSYAGILNVRSVPEPTSLLLLGAGLAGIGIWRRKLA